MNFSLKIKLTITYVVLSLFLIGSLMLVSNYVLEEKFQSYIMESQEKKNYNIVNLVKEAFEKNKVNPTFGELESIGNTALSQGLILMVSDSSGQEIFCMSNIESEMCENMLASMKNHMASIYPDFDGKYLETSYPVTIDGEQEATVTLGYYGPFYYSDEDVQFLEVLNQIFMTVSGFFLVVAAILGYVMAGRIVKPIKKVIEKTRELEQGNYKERVHQNSRTKEILQLVESVNTLADSLERQQQSKKRMARDYAHEFRTPLATLQSNLEAMIDGIWEPTGERLESCRSEVLRLTRMIADIDKIVQIERDTDTLSKREFDLKTSVEHVFSSFETEMKMKEITFVKDLDSVTVFADEDKMIQVIFNLLSNALKYTNPSGKVEVTLRKSGNQAILKVIDTGIGIEEEDIGNIFEHLYRADKSRDRQTGGSGIGLSVVKAIVEGHGGKVSVKSQVQVGSEFMVVLPVKEKE